MTEAQRPEGVTGNYDADRLLDAQHQQNLAQHSLTSDQKAMTFTVIEASRGGFMIVQDGQVAAKTSIDEVLALLHSDLTIKFGGAQRQPAFQQPSGWQEPRPHAHPAAYWDHQGEQPPAPRAVYRSYDYDDVVGVFDAAKERITGYVKNAPLAVLGGFLMVVGTTIGAFAASRLF